MQCWRKTEGRWKRRHFSNEEENPPEGGISSHLPTHVEETNDLWKDKSQARLHACKYLETVQMSGVGRGIILYLPPVPPGVDPGIKLASLKPKVNAY